MNQPHEWTESGRELLRIFKIEIQHNGGVYKTYCKVQRETNRRIYKFKEVKSEPSVNSIIFNNWHKTSLRNIAKLAGVSCSTVLLHGRFLGLPAKEWYAVSHWDKPVFNLETGIYYDSIAEAAKTINRCPDGLSRKLKGMFKNNTSFILI